jgi:hypothetical protein
VVAEAGELARSAGVTAAITVEHPEVPHRFPPEQREHAYQLFDATLKLPRK